MTGGSRGSTLKCNALLSKTASAVISPTTPNVVGDANASMMDGSANATAAPLKEKNYEYEEARGSSAMRKAAKVTVC